MDVDDVDGMWNRMIEKRMMWWSDDDDMEDDIDEWSEVEWSEVEYVYMYISCEAKYACVRFTPTVKQTVA